jgi:hypothetical protein
VCVCVCLCVCSQSDTSHTTCHVALALKMVCVQARKTRLTSITEGIVDIGWAKLSLLMATFVAGILLGVFCTVFCFMR